MYSTPCFTTSFHGCSFMISSQFACHRAAVGGVRRQGRLAVAYRSREDVAEIIQSSRQPIEEGGGPTHLLLLHGNGAIRPCTKVAQPFDLVAHVPPRSLRASARHSAASFVLATSVRLNKRSASRSRKAAVSVSWARIVGAETINSALLPSPDHSIGMCAMSSLPA